MKRFLTFRFGTAPGDLNTIARDDIVSFLDSPDTATGGGRSRLQGNVSAQPLRLPVRDRQDPA